MDQQTKLDIELLLHVARSKVEEADQGGGTKLFNEVGETFGPTAHRVYLALDRPVRTVKNYHNRSMTRVLLDPWTVLNRARSYGIRDTEISIDNLEFWLHGDMIKTLIDYLSLTYLKEDIYGSATGT